MCIRDSIGSVVAIDVGLTSAAPATTDMHGGLGGLALADDRLQGQGGWRTIFQAQFGAQFFHLHVGQFL